MAKSGSWANGSAPAQGAADSPHFSSAHVGSGFKWGICQVSEKSRDALGMPKTLPNSSGAGMKPKNGNWGEGFHNHH